MRDYKFTLELVEKFSTLITAGLGLVAALAWNTAIQNLVITIFGSVSTLVAQFVYALVITLLVVYITYRLGKVTKFLKDSIEKENKEGV